MAQLSQPAATAAMERWFAAAALHVGPVLNAVAVVVLLGLGVSLLLGRRSLLVPAAVGYSAVALLAWVLVQDLGVFGGVGTDVNSMVPSVLVVVSLVVALRQAPATAVATVPDEQAQVVRRTRAMLGSAAAAIFALGAVGMLVLPILPGASADAAVAAGSGVASLSGVAPGFTLTDQHGRTVTLASLKGRTVVLAFLDPVCTSDCPIEAQELKAAAAALGPDAKVTFVAINANPTYRSIAALQAFDEREGLADESRWLYLTGSTAALQAAWNAYGVVVTSPGAGSMVSHAEPIFVIRPDGRLFSTWTAAVGDGGGSVLGRSTTSLVIAQVQAAS
jgi:cytochrome oxidase Cu insertion factor (SCO1/SenC/PrrC family)